MYHKNLNKSGFTLIELVVSTALVTLVLALIFSVFLIGNRTYSYGSTQRDIQADLRLASDVIRDEVRYASDIELFEIDDPYVIETIKNYIYITADNKSLMLCRSGGSPTEIISFIGTDILMNVVFSKDSIDNGIAISYSKSGSGSSNVDNILNYTLKGESSSKNREYQVQTDVILLNMRSQIPNSTEYTVTTPSVENVLISGEFKTGNKITVTYDYSNSDGSNQQGESIITWYKYSDVKLNRLLPPLQTGIYDQSIPASREYIIDIGDKKYNIYVVVTPKDPKDIGGGTGINAESEGVYIRN